MSSSFIEAPSFLSWLKKSQVKNNSLLCVGLDPDIDRFPELILKTSAPVFEFNKQIIDATQDLVCCYKPQIAHYAALGAENQLTRTIEYIHSKDLPVLLDAKRGDIGNTAEKYAEEAFTRYGADAVTVNPYLGLDAMAPFLAYQNKGIVILCRTSNPGGADIQNLALKNGSLIYEHIARQASEGWNYNANTLLLVGATRPEELARIRQIVGDMTLLLAGVGAQGADISAMMEAGKGGGLIVNSSRAILYGSGAGDFAQVARQTADATRVDINRQR